ncbi:MAG: hypothetical protein K6E10_12180 [Eubacterium sp.]|nr:hypothetical protein [Eubacterium sp.]
MSESVKEKVIMVTGVLVYVFFAIYVAFLIKMGLSSPALYMDLINKVKPFTAFLELIAVVDAVLIYIFEKNKISLILFSIFLLPFYPLYRDKIYRPKYNVGALLTLAFFIGMILVAVLVFRSTASYGKLFVNVNDKETLDEAMAVMDYEAEEGKSYSRCLVIKGKFTPMYADLSKSGGETTIAITGNGFVDVVEKQRGYVEVYSVNKESTTLTFEKNKDDGYTLKKVKVGNHKLSEKEKDVYYDKVILE